MPGVQATGGGITVSTMSYGLLFDIDGVMVTSWQALPGAADAVAELARRPSDGGGQVTAAATVAPATPATEARDGGR